MLITFCIIHMIKCIRNNLTSKGNFFHYLSLSLSNGITLNSGCCDFKWMRKSHNKFKEELVVDVKITRQAAHPHNLEKQKVAPALLVFSDQVTAALKVNFGDQAKGTYEFYHS